MTLPFRPAMIAAGVALMALSGCEEPLDLDLRGKFGGNSLNTAEAARKATAPRPQPDNRGIISYPGYQVAVARRGDTLADVARRIGVDADTLARHNGIQPGDMLRKGEIVALPGRVAEPVGGPIRPPNGDITAIAGNAIESAEIQTSPLQPAPIVGVEPVRHKVERGETAFTIARLYNVSIRSLADWNGLGSDFAVREGQFLLIPVALPGEQTAPFDATDVPQTEQPGEGTPAPTPPSASKPLPAEDTVAASEPVKENAAPDLGGTQTSASAGSTRMGFPVRGDIVREYSKGKNEGIDIAANPGTPVKAAARGTVGAVTQDTRGNAIIVIIHPDGLRTVYANLDGVVVKKGETVARGQKIAEIRAGDAGTLHFQVRDGFDSVDPVPYLR